MLLVEASRSVYLGAQAYLLDDSREMAWADGKSLRKHPTIRYLAGRYVEADNANSNGHVFKLEELENAQHDIAHTPLNMLHRPHYIVGHYIDAQLMFPKDEAGEGLSNPYVEAVAAFYRYYFPDEFAEVERAHKEGSLFYSMECVPKSVTCTAVCGQEFAYDGRTSPTYCAHINEPGAVRTLNQPGFTGGALIIPPIKPGWKKADITEVSRLLRQHSEQAEHLYDDVRSEMPNASVEQWEWTVGQLLDMAYEDIEGGEWARDFNTAKRKQLAKSGAALPDGSYPIVTVQDLANAIRAYGRANPSDRARVKAHIKKRAAALGATSKLPKDW
jgi:hypothetical protein